MIIKPNPEPPHSRGFTRLELLLTLLSLGLVSFIAVAGMGDALDRTAQKVTLLDLRRMGGALQVYRKDYGGYPCSAFDGNATYLAFHYDALGSPAIVPDLITEVPRGDGWGGPYDYFAGSDGTSVQPKLSYPVSNHFCLWSYGSDRAEASNEPNSWGGVAIAVAWCTDPPYRGGTQHTHCYQTDIVWADGGFLQSPEGPQRNCPSEGAQ